MEMATEFVGNEGAGVKKTHHFHLYKSHLVSTVIVFEELPWAL